jgi:hypothetical protein
MLEIFRCNVWYVYNMEINDTTKIYLAFGVMVKTNKTLQTSASNLWPKERALCTHTHITHETMSIIANVSMAMILTLRLYGQKLMQSESEVSYNSH